MSLGFYSGRRPASEFEYSTESSMSHDYLGPRIEAILSRLSVDRFVDLGCGNGTLTTKAAGVGREFVGLDGSKSGIENARSAHPQFDFRLQNFDEDLPEDLRGAFSFATSIEVIEHLYYPRSLFARASEALCEDGYLLVTTPYHGYVKNLTLAALNKFDEHWRPGWDHGHIKFFSVRTLAEMTLERGFVPVYWEFIGRLPTLAKSMLMIAKKAPSS